MMNCWCLVTTLLVWSNYCVLVNSSLTFQSFVTGTPISHVVKFNNTYFIGSTNVIYQIDESFEIIQQLQIGPTKGNEDNFVTMMLVSSDPDKPVLFWCGSVDLGLCHVNLLRDINAGDFLHEEYFTDRLQDYFDKNSVEDGRQLELIEHGTYGHLGSRVGSKAIFVDISENSSISNSTRSTELILASAMYDGRRNHSLPILGLYSLRKTRDGANYFMKPSAFDLKQMKFSYLPIYPGLLHQYPIAHVSMFESGEYVYVIVTQKEQIVSPLHFQTRVGRFNKSDILFKTYIEVPVRCETDNHNYNIAMDAHLSSAATDLHHRLNMTGGSASGKVLYFLQGEAGDFSSYPTLNSAVVCALPLSSISSHMDKEMRRCHRGRGNLVEWYYGREQKCQVTRVFNGVNDAEKQALHLLMKGRTLNLEPILTLPYNATMLHTEIQGQTTVAIVGNNNGGLQKINLATGSVYHSSDQSSGGGHIQGDSIVSDDMLVTVSGSEVVGYPLRSCELYNTAESCTSTNDPLRCGWCSGQRCTTQMECTESGSSEWYHHAPPPQIDTITPNNGSIHGNTTLTITGSYFTPANQTVNSSISVFLHNTSCRVTAVLFRSVTCITEQVSSPWTGQVTVIRQDVIGSVRILTRGHSSTRQHYSYLVPQYMDLAPRYGPIHGGTTLTLTGRNLLLGNSVTVKAGGVKCNIQRISAEMLTCVTSPVVTPRTVSLVIFSDGKPQFETDYIYKPNPVINTPISRRVHAMLSGGIPICFNGQHVDSINFPLAEFSFPQLSGELHQPIIQICFMKTSSELCCPVPDLTKRVTISQVSGIGTIRSNMVLRMDGVSLPAGFVFYHPLPVVYTGSAIQQNVVDKIALTIQGKGFEHLYPNFINITTSLGVACLVDKCKESYITCTLNSRADSSLKSDYITLIFRYGNFIMDLKPILVESSAAISGRVTMKETGRPSADVLVACIVSLFVAITVISAITCLVVRRMRKKPPATNVPSVSYIHHPENGTTIEFEENEAYLGIQHSFFGAVPTLHTVALREKVKAKGALIELSRLHMGAEIGSGCFGKVFKGFLDEKTHGNRITHKLVAIKAVKGSQITVEDVNTFVDEALLMQTFRHEHVLTMLGISFDIYGQPLVVLPFLGRGDLRSYLKNANNAITVDDKLGFANDVAMGMNYLEDVLCVHRDLAARNCMLDDNMRVKVADFGLSRDLDNFENKLYESTAKTAKLPVKWMSPESLLYRHYSSKSDVWAYGVTMWEIFSRGAYPYPDVDNFEIVEYVKAGGRLSKPDKCPKEIYQLMSSTWQFDAEARPNFANIVNELQLFIANHSSLPVTKGSPKEASHGMLSRSARSSDSGNHSDLETLRQVVVEDYLLSMPSYSV